MAGKAMTPMSAKASRPVTLKHLAARLAADHELTEREGEAILGDLVSLITKHLRKASGSELRVLASCRSGNARPAWGETPRPEKPSRSKRARRSHSGRPST